jgi:hypothetical protein
MTVTAEVAAQLADELGGAVYALAVLAGPAEVVQWPATLADRAEVLAAQLCQDDDDKLAAQTVIDAMGALWPHGDPESVGRVDWWRTPLGRMCARSLGRDDAEAVTQSVAAAMLGVTLGTVKQLVARGNLDRHPDGGVTRASVLARLVRLG